MINFLLKSNNMIVKLLRRKGMIMMETVQITKAQICVSDAASLAGTSSFTIYKAISKGKLKAHKEGRSWKIIVSDFEDYLKRNNA